MCDLNLTVKICYQYVRLIEEIWEKYWVFEARGRGKPEDFPPKWNVLGIFA